MSSVARMHDGSAEPAASFRAIHAAVPAVLLARALAPAVGLDLPLDVRAAAAWLGLGALWAVCVALPVFRKTGPDALHVGAVALILLFSRAPHAGIADPATLAVIAIIVGFVLRGDRDARFRAAPFLLRWSPLLFAAYVYVSLPAVLPSEPAWRADALLSQWDRALFPVALTELASRAESPMLTDWLAAHYLSYLAYPVLVAALLDLRGRTLAFERHVTAFTIAMFTGFLFYVLVPARGPWMSGAENSAFPEGIVVGPLTEAIVRRFSYPWDGFPSMHIANSLLAVFYAREISPRAFRIALACQVNLALSTIYLRLHYGVDVIAGVALAIAVAAITASLVPRARRP